MRCDGRPKLPVRGGCGPAAGGEFPHGSQEPEEAALGHGEEVKRPGARHQQGGQITVLLASSVYSWIVLGTP